MSLRSVPFTALCAALGAAACASTGETVAGQEPDVEVAASPIYDDGSGDVTPDNAAHPQIMPLRSPTQGFQFAECTGVLVASNVVLTAAHCTHAANAPYPGPYVPATGTYSVFAAFNASPATANALLPIAPMNWSTGFQEWTTASANVIPHPEFTESSSPSVDLALLVMPTSIPRSVMKPMPIIDRYPSPPLDPAAYGTIESWAGFFAEEAGGGHTNAGCTTGAPSPIARLRTMIGGVIDDPLNGPEQTIVLGGSMTSAGAHVCFGDSGGPILSFDEGGSFGRNIPGGHIISLIATDANGVHGPVLQEEPVRSWLINNALDRDHDGVLAANDNCDRVANTNQLDFEHDGIGDACDPDDDNDGVLDINDNCRFKANPAQIDADFDNVGQACDPDEDSDVDNDGVPNISDNCPLDPNQGQENVDPQIDNDGDACDEDMDNDGISNDDDNCLWVANANQLNSDGDAFGDACEVCDFVHETNMATGVTYIPGFPPNFRVLAPDTDGDGTPDACDNTVRINGQPMGIGLPGDGQPHTVLVNANVPVGGVQRMVLRPCGSPIPCGPRRLRISPLSPGVKPVLTDVRERKIANTVATNSGWTIDFTPKAGAQYYLSFVFPLGYNGGVESTTVTFGPP